MNTFKSLLCAIVLTGAYSANATDWPLYFDAIDKDRYVLVVLHEGGRAQYFDRMADTDPKGRPTGNVFIQHDDDATWGSFPEDELKNKGRIPQQQSRIPGQQNKSAPVIWVRTNQFRFDYFIEEDRLTEFDKVGIQRVLKKRKNLNQRPK
jgi:hypothetical protein